ncbi:hypothetical protein VUR80DRAFT_4358 [Thermomyces stellatus]
MTTSFHETTAPLFRSALASLKAILKKAEAHASEHAIPPDSLLDWRLAPDMLPLSFQVHEVTDTAARLVARTSAVDPPAWTPDDLRTLPEAWARISEAEGWLDKADGETFERRADEEVPVGLLALGVERSEDVPLRGWVAMYAIPTLFFHLSVAYGILRSKGVALGKMHFIGGFAAPWISI